MLNDYIAISGLPGLYKMVANRPNGLIVEDIENKKKRFCSVRKHQFTPLGSISIYTVMDTVPLLKVFKKIDEVRGSLEFPQPKSSNQVFVDYFKQIIPEFDTDRVYPSDIKKLIKWFQFFLKHDLLETALVEEETNDEEE